MDVLGSTEFWIFALGGGFGAALLFAALRALPPRAEPHLPSERRSGTAAAAAPAVAEPPAAAAPAPSPAARLRAALAKTRNAFRARIDEALGSGMDRTAALESLEEALVSADVGMRATARILERVRDHSDGHENASALRSALVDALVEILEGDDGPPRDSAKPWVMLVAGVNGVGKTTSIGKLAARFRAEGKSVLLVAADTFRAAAIDQLGIWGERVGVEVVRHQSGSDPAAVAFDGVKAARARGVDVVIVDTAGRLHTRQNLMDELKKVVRVVGREMPGAPHEVLLVVDATTGQNAVNQARTFGEAIGVTGVVLTKLDGTAKGGAALAVREELGVPIRFVGVGEGVEDLRPFSSRDYVAGLLEDGETVP